MTRWVDSWVHGAHGVERLAAFFEACTDPWDRLPLACAPNAFGVGSTRSFADYFQGTSQVTARSLEEICAWLQGCECRSDHALFRQEDHWLHPLAFERLRQGDCEDHALWAWRKLAEIGMPARFTAGRWEGVAHAWLVLDQTDGTRIFETTAKSRAMLLPFDPETRAAYCPALSIDHALRTYVHAGYPRFRNGP